MFTLGCYVLAMALALLRLYRGPSAQDRVLAMDLIYTIGMLVMMVLAIRYRSSMYFRGGAADRPVRLRQLHGHGQVPAARRGDRMNPELFGWVEAAVALLLVLSGIFTLAAAVGVVRFETFFQRMHPPALAFSLSSWCVTLATILVLLGAARAAGPARLADHHLPVHHGAGSPPSCWRAPSCSAAARTMRPAPTSPPALSHDLPRPAPSRAEANRAAPPTAELTQRPT